MKAKKIRLVQKSNDFEYRIKAQFYSVLQTTGGNPSQLLDLLVMIVESRIWETRGISFAEFLTRPFDEGLNWSQDNLQAVLKMSHVHEKSDAATAQRMAKLRRTIEDLLSPTALQHGQNRSMAARQNNVRSSTKQYGNSRQHTLSRLKRDHPDLANKVLNGELSSNAAAIMAGIRTKKVYFDPSSVTKTANTLRKHLPPDHILELIRELSK